jgi:hypothetical protein
MKSPQSRPFSRLIAIAIFAFSAIGILPTLTHSTRAQTMSLGELQRGFKDPPDDARIMMRWWWYGPAVTKKEIEREMRMMKEGGIGGFEVQVTYPLSPDDQSAGIKNLPYLSDEFIDALRFTSEKAHELGMRMDLTLGSGWPYGGPQVPINQAAGKLRYEHVKVNATTGRVKVPYIGNGEKLVAVFLATARDQGFASESLRTLHDIKDGWVQLDAGVPDASEVLFFISSRTGMQVKRPAVGAEGFVLDHLDHAAIDNYLKKVGDRLMTAFGAHPPHAIFCDSLEVYGNDWTGNIMEEFEKRRGYDLMPYLPALVGDIGPKTANIRHDWGMTLTELLNEHFLGPMRDWSKRNHVLFRIQDYGVPAATLASNAYADLPEGEGAAWRNLSATRWASSASHLYGHQITSSETWTWLHSPVFRATPLDMKAEADRHFLQGINQLIGHGWPYTPEGVEYPGWRFYAAGVWDEKNPWWIVMPDVARYLQRLSFLLRQGEPANDVALYLPNHDAWAHFTASTPSMPGAPGTPGSVHMIDELRLRLGANVIPELLDSGYNFDFFDDETLKQVGKVENGALVLGGHKYKAVVLPDVGRIPLETYVKLQEFARGGGVLVATHRTPLETPGFKATAADHEKILAISKAVFKDPSAPGHFVEDDTKLGSSLANLLHPDVTLSPATPDIGFIHRRTADAEIYFLANTGNGKQNVDATFRVADLQPEWWDPLTGTVTPAPIKGRPSRDTTVSLSLEPYGSCVLIFSKQSPGTEAGLPKAVAGRAVDLSVGWHVSFGANGKTLEMDKLSSWTDDEAFKYFSGTAVYEKEMSMPLGFDDLTQNTARLMFGEGQALPVQQSRSGMQTWFDPPIREAAVIYVNDQRAGSLWCPPYSLDVTNLMKPGQNKLRIVVANTALNYMAGHSLPDYRLLSLRFGERFQAQDMDKIQALPSGLLGPVRLLAMRK